MKAMIRRSLVIGYWVLATVVLDGASIVVSLERTTMSVDNWQLLMRDTGSIEEQVKQYAGDRPYVLEGTDDRLEFIFEYADGWDYQDYQTWKMEYIPILNDNLGRSPGVEWRVRSEGTLSEETSPWREVLWLPGVRGVQNEYLWNPSFGWMWARDWNADGGFWAYTFNLEVDWLYVAGEGYYYEPAKARWIWNWPGTAWFTEIDSMGTSSWEILSPGSWPTMSSLDAIIKDEMIKQNLPGVAVGVFENGKFVHMAGYGLSDIETGAPVTVSTIFRWASISKPLTAVAALQLDEFPNNFSITDNVTEHVPYWTNSNSNWASQITIQQLLSNRSGIHHYGNGRDGDNDGDPDNTFSYDESQYNAPDPSGYDASEAVAVFSGTGMDFQPGTNYLYTTFGFNLLGSAIDEAYFPGYVNWVMDRIADPLGMTSLAVSTTNRTGYDRACDGEIKANVIGSVEWKLPGGGWESNIVDLMRFTRGIADGSLLNNNARLWTNVPGNTQYAYGVNTAGSGDSLRVWHDGAHANLRTLMIAYPNTNYGIGVMIWADYADPWRIVNRIRDEMGVITWDGDISPVDVCDSTMSSCSGKFAGVWRQTGEDVIIRRGYSHSAFFKEWKWMRSNGYYCDDFEPHLKDGNLIWDGIFRKGPGGNGMWRNYTFDGFYDKWQEQSAAGYRLVDLETYVVNGNRRWAGLFRPGSGGYAMWRDFSTEGFAEKRAEMDAEGLKLIDIEVYVENGQLRWSGVWVEGEEGLLNRNYTSAEFSALWNERTDNGWKLVDIEAYRFNGEQYWAGIWEADNSGEALYRNWEYCDFMDLHSDLSGSGYELLDMEHYDY